MASPELSGGPWFCSSPRDLFYRDFTEKPGSLLAATKLSLVPALLCLSEWCDPPCGRRVGAPLCITDLQFHRGDVLLESRDCGCKLPAKVIN